MRQYIILALISISVVGLILPVTLLADPTFTEYMGPERFAQTPAVFIAYFVGSLGLTTAYVFLVRKLKHIVLNRLLLFAVALTVGTFSIVSYPFVYDPLYYHIAAFTSNLGINPYLVDFTIYRKLLPISFPIPHSYAYGPLWLTVSRIIEMFTTSQIGFVIVNKFSGITGLLSTLILYKIYAPNIKMNHVSILLLLNPAVVFFALTGGLIDIWVAFFVLLAVLLIKHNKYLFTGIAISIATLIKPTVAVLILPLLAYSYNRNRFSSAIRYGVGLIPLLIAGVFLLQNPAYLDGLKILKHLEQASQLSLGSTFAVGIAILFQIPYEISQPFIHFTLNLGATAWILYISILIIKKQMPFTKFAGYLALTAILVPFFTGFIVKPWYILPALVLAPLAQSIRLQYVISLVGVFLYVSTLYFNMSTYFIPSEKFFWISMGIIISFIVVPIFLMRETKHMRSSS